MFLTRDEKLLIRESLQDRATALRDLDHHAEKLGRIEALLHKFAVHFQEVPKK